MNTLTTVPLVDVMAGMTGDQIIAYAEQSLGLPAAACRRAISATLHAAVDELGRKAAQDPLAAHDLVVAPNLYRDVVTSLNALLANLQAAEPLVAHGQTLVERLFGARGVAVTKAIAEQAELNRTQAANLIPLTLVVGLGALKADLNRDRVDARAFARILAAQPASPQQSTPAARPETPELPPRPVAPVPNVPTMPQAPPRRAAIWKWLLPSVAVIAVAAIIGLYKLETQRTERSVTTSIERTTTQATRTPAVAEITDRRVRLSALQFEHGSATPGPEARAALERVLRSTSADLTVRVEGFTDSSGDAERNQAIALARANAVASMLEALGVRRDRISVRGRADEAPLAPNDTAAGRARNRRVEIVLGDD